MNHQQYPELISGIIDLVRAGGPIWVIRQVAEDFLPNVSDLNDQEIDTLLEQTNNPTGVILSLLRALEITVVETAFMEEAVKSYFLNKSPNAANSQSNSDEDAQLYAESENEGPVEIFSFSDMDIPKRIHSAQTLLTAINDLRKQLG